MLDADLAQLYGVETRPAAGGLTHPLPSSPPISPSSSRANEFDDLRSQSVIPGVNVTHGAYRRSPIPSSVLQLMLYATIFNINDGIALFPLQLLFCKFFVVVGFIVDVPDPSVMQRPPRKPAPRWSIRRRSCAGPSPGSQSR